MKYSLILTLFLVVTAGCSDAENTRSGMFSFVLGDLTTTEAVRQFVSGSNADLDIRIESDNLCPDYGVELIVTGGGVDYENIVISQFPYADLLTIPDNAAIEISTAIVALPNTMITCVTLGDVLFEFKY